MMSEKNRFIAHVDMDAFFASIEQRDNHAYCGKPVIVGANPKKGIGRGVVSTCSYEARKFGIHSAMPISIAYRKCPQAIFVPVDYKKYTQASQQIINILKNFSPLVEQISIDEAFLDISDTYKLFGTTPYDACVFMKNRIKKEIGLSASIGLAPTKMAAKIASGLKKPNGLVEVKKEELLNFLLPLNVECLWGIGKKTKENLNKIGIYTIGDLAKKSKKELIGAFGKNGAWFSDLSRGIDKSEVIPWREAKSISNEMTFENDVCDSVKIEKELVWLCELVADRMRKNSFKAKTISLKVRFSGFQTYTRAITVQEPTNFSEDLIKEIRRLYEKVEIKNRKVRLVGVRVLNLSTQNEESLFKDEKKEKMEDIHKAVDKIRSKFGRTSILSATSV